MSWPYKVFIEIVHDENHQSVYHVQFHPSPFLYMGDKKLIKGGQGPYDSHGLLGHIRKDKIFDKINLYTNLPEQRIKRDDDRFSERLPGNGFRGEPIRVILCRSYLRKSEMLISGRYSVKKDSISSFMNAVVGSIKALIVSSSIY